MNWHDKKLFFGEQVGTEFCRKIKNSSKIFPDYLAMWIKVNIFAARMKNRFVKFNLLIYE